MRPLSRVPFIDTIEDRTVLSTLTVLNNLDRGPGSLRDKIVHRPFIPKRSPRRTGVSVGHARTAQEFALA
jgi:hypothetical protein